MDLAQLRAFVAIVDAGGVSRAAERLHVSQPALSRQLQTLEADLGVSLFDRSQRRLRLTTAGEDLLRRSRGILHDAESLKERARSLRSEVAGVLKLGATPPTIEAPLAPFLGGWIKRHPEIEVHLLEDGGTHLAERLEAGDVHVAYVPAGDSRFDYQLLYPIHVVAAVGARHELARGGPCLELGRLAGADIMALRAGFGSRDWFDIACRAGEVRPNIVFESASHDAILALAAAGYGIGILPSAVAPGPEGVRLMPLVHNGAPLGRWTMIAWSKRRHLPAYAKTFVDEFSAYARINYPGRTLVKRAPRIEAPPGTSAGAPLRASARRAERAS